MSLRFFADQCISNILIAALQNSGYEVLLLKDHLPVESLDEDVIAKAQELDTILLSLNGDFANIINYPPSKYKGIVCIQVKGRPEAIPHITVRLKTYLAEHPDPSHYTGRLFIVDVNRIRIR